MVVNDEEGAEYSVLDGPRREVMGEVPSPVPPDLRDVDNESMFEYGSRGGIWRRMRVLVAAAVPAGAPARPAPALSPVLVAGALTQR